MPSYTFSLPSLLLLLSTSLSLVSSTPISSDTCKSADEINWFDCPQQDGVPLYRCGTLEVPLDYTNASSTKTLTLELVKVLAKKPKKGSILFNNGGPGELVRAFVAGSFAEFLLVMTGGEYDLIGFDTRGTGNTIPFSCFNNTETRTLVEIVDPVYLNSSDTAIGTIYANQVNLAYQCYEANKETGNLLGTAFVARDMIRIVDALKEDGLLRYWGLSYGTTLGATVTAMFPDRIDKIVLDGVQNPHEYSAGANIQEIADTDLTFHGFFQGCLDNPKNCALSVDGTSANDLENKVYNLLYTLKYNPISFPPLGLVIDYTLVKGYIEQSLYDTSTWPTLAYALHGVLNNNLTFLFEILAASNTSSSSNTSTPFPNNGPEANYGIRCGDSALRSNSLTPLYPIIEKFYHASKLYGDVLPAQVLQCAPWLFTAKERYTGDFCVKPRKPVLIIGSMHDPLTPLVSARNLSAGFEGSVVLQHNGYGHTSTAQPSLCTARYIRSYFVNGTLPHPNTKCEPSIPLFDDQHWAVALAPITDFNLTKRAFDYAKNEEEDDAVLLDAMMNLNGRIRRRGKGLGKL